MKIIWKNKPGPIVEISRSAEATLSDGERNEMNRLLLQIKQDIEKFQFYAILATERAEARRKGAKAGQ